LLLIALLPRLIYLFAISNPENAGDGLYTDVYQHWQIAYLTKEIGLSHGLRLWDLKGVEYFWGSLHPIVLVILFLSLALPTSCSQGSRVLPSDRSAWC